MGHMISAEKIMGFIKTIVGKFAEFWNKLVNWLKAAITKIKSVLNKAISGAKVYAQRIGEKYQKISKFYSKNGTVWEEYIATKEVDDSEVPDFIRAMDTDDAIDITEELENKLTT